ncbi:MAG: hypothetical protein ABSD08_11685 [Xanthobacteraceae bacterium]|jgi:hypothetical protein
MTNQPPRTAVLKDNAAWGAAILTVGSPISRLLTWAEHVEFLISLKDEKFKTMVEWWTSWGWIAGLVVGALWLYYRYSQRSQTAHPAPTWGFVAVCTFMAFVYGSIIASLPANDIPNPIIKIGGTPPNLCGATIDASVLISFKDKYKMALTCNIVQSTVDLLDDKRIAVSNLFDITAGTRFIEAEDAPNILIPNDNEERRIVRNHDPFGVQYLVILLPRDVPKGKITCLRDVILLSGKIIDKRYYK